MSTCQMFTILATLLAFQVASLNGAPVSTTSQAEIYLSQFGYLSASARHPASGGLVAQETWVSAIQEFQSFAGLNVTGELDDETLQLMSLPRCGVRDRVGTGNSRSKRYALQGSRWRVKNLTYKIAKYPKRLKRADVDTEIQRAFSVWSQDTDLTFTRKTTGPVHIEIKFVENEHGDGDAFDGQGGTLAHAFFPVFGGDAHFDDAELWTIGSARGTNLFQVAAHEFGHSLGLSHSDQNSALMAPFYRGFEPVFRLDDDDKAAIQSLYGRKTNINQYTPTNIYPPSTKRPSFATPLDDSLCKDPRIDSAFTSAEGDTFVFKGDKYYKLTVDAVADGYPKLISNGWPGLPSNIDAAFTYKNGKTYFFKGSQYWRYKGSQMDGDYPKEISDGFTGIPDHVDAAMVWGGNGKIYFFKGSKFWRFDPSKKPPVKASYPKPISNWDGVPNNLDAAVKYTNGYTYFFKGDKYYRFHDARFTVDSASPPFPRPTGHWWFGCKGTTSSTGNIVEDSQLNSDDGNGYEDLDTAVGDHQSNDEPTPEVAERTGSGAMTQMTSSSAIGVLFSTFLLCCISKLIVS